MMNKYSKGPMPFRYAWFQMLNGKKVKLPSWAGYWAWEDGTINEQTIEAWGNERMRTPYRYAVHHSMM